MSTNETTADLWSSSTANSPDKARVYRATIAPHDQCPETGYTEIV